MAHWNVFLHGELANKCIVCPPLTPFRPTSRTSVLNIHQLTNKKVGLGSNYKVVMKEVEEASYDPFLISGTADMQEV